MRPLNEIIEEHSKDGVLDLGSIIPVLSDGLMERTTPITPTESLHAFIEAQDQVNHYLGQLVLSVASEVNALPKGFDQELGTFKAFLAYSSLSALYGEKEATESEGQPRQSEGQPRQSEGQTQLTVIEGGQGMEDEPPKLVVIDGGQPDKPGDGGAANIDG